MKPWNFITPTLFGAALLMSVPAAAGGPKPGERMNADFFCHEVGVIDMANAVIVGKEAAETTFDATIKTGTCFGTPYPLHIQVVQKKMAFEDYAGFDVEVWSVAMTDPKADPVYIFVQVDNSDVPKEGSF